ncbi:MAG: elongation factor P--(R)-beta-lysine ligase [Spirochaetes bacterium]|uniref:Elongation factor P--(R)-beta-lysine ligase n=1 Tax=Candidatus Ornithospirochaeta stercoripullorum TaxID=2840899 RepID=A0A9D9H563_9SPIO|nr:elongation factor P--(R)-beta-lysine ligase [Candidatus Ornithospirochaeta stercoripullorum]
MYNFEAARKRSELLMNIKQYFIGKDYLEVSTPTLSPYLIPEPTIKAFSTRFINEFTGSKELYLIPSPEIFMKKLLAAGSGSIFQISQCFRNSEQLGDVHNPEFTMLEYYTVGADEKDSIAITEDMIRQTALKGISPSWLNEKPLVITMSEAMMKYASVDMDKAENIEYLRKEAVRLGLEPGVDESWDDTFNRIFLTYTEPSLPKDREVYLTEYPDKIACLAKNEKGRPVKKRWEMYIAGIEIANCYDEETDKAETERYFREEEERMHEMRVGTEDVIPLCDPAFPSLSIPQSSGGAMGLDRLLAVHLGLNCIEPLLLFPLSDMLRP